MADWRHSSAIEALNLLFLSDLQSDDQEAKISSPAVGVFQSCTGGPG